MKALFTHYCVKSMLAFSAMLLLCTNSIQMKAQSCPPPQIFDVTGGCVDGSINMSGSEIGITYTLAKLIPGEFQPAVIAQVQGTGAAIIFQPPFDVGTYFVIARNSCSLSSVNMNGTIAIGPHPQVYNVTGGCVDMPINVSGSQVGVNYNLLKIIPGTEGSQLIATLQGTGESISFAQTFQPGEIYVVVASNACTNGVSVPMTGTITIVPHPQIFTLTGGCFGSPLILSGSQGGVTYHLMTYDFAATPIQVAQLQGTGGPLSFSAPSPPGPYPYFVMATNACSPFGTAMNGNINFSNPPQVFNVTGGCGGTPINLSGSETGVTYHLIESELGLGEVAHLQGTGNPLSFPGPFPLGLYTVIATNSCKPAPAGSNMNGTVYTGSALTFYRDRDGDGYGDPSKTAQGCTAPAGYVSNSTDCNDNDKTVHASFLFYVDADGDGYGANNSQAQFVCAVDANTPPPGYSVNNTDCDDNDKTVHASFLFYVDADGDGYGANNSQAQLVCAVDANSPPPGYSVNNTDCDDNDKTVYASFGFYIDNDGDGYGASNSKLIEVCAADANTPPPGYSVNNTDCDDNDKTVHGYFAFYIDNDGDGYGAINSKMIEVCAADANTPPKGYSVNNTDCDDSDPNVWQWATLFIDNDGDGYDNGTSIVCYGATVPVGYSVASNGSDCNDNDKTVHGYFEFYIDNDGDGYGAANSKMAEVCAVDANTPPKGYSVNNTDCDDTDPNVWQSATLFIDNDGDGYDNGTSIICFGATVPAGFSVASNGTDCNDNDKTVHGYFAFYIDNDYDGYGAINSKMTFVCAVDANTPPKGYSVNNTDCDDSNPNVWQSAMVYIDLDGDGYDNGHAVVCYGATVPAGYSLSTKGSDCNDKDKTVNGAFGFYVDADGDGYGANNSKIAEVCAVDANTPPKGYSVNNTDCDDSNPNVWQSGMLYIDLDGDGYDNGHAAVCYGATVPAGYSLGTKGSDCNDNDKTVHGAFGFYVDADGDGYGASNSKIVEVCAADANTPPKGYSVNNMDCNDNDPAIHPGATDIPDDKIDQNCDGFDLRTWYKDADGDGYGNPALHQTANTQPVGYVSNNTDCDDNNAAIHPGKPKITCPSALVLCYSSSGTYTIPTMAATDNCTTQSIKFVISGATSRSGNGNDASGAFNPGTSTITWTVTDGSGNISTCSATVKVDKVDVTVADAYASGITASIGSANTIYIGYGGSSVTLTAQLTSSVAPNSYTYKWTTGSPAGPGFATTQSITISPSATTTYFVSIKDVNNCAQTVQVSKQISVVDIRCGSGKINVCQFKNGSYTTSCVSSTTKTIGALPAGSYLGACVNTTIAKKAIPERGALAITANPNPSNASFTVKVSSAADESPMTLRVFNINGQLVEIKKINAMQTFKLGENYKSGVYLIEVIAGLQRKTVTVIKQ